jgi:hypothetical protein
VDTLTGVAVLRLRPITHASPLPDGFHVRGAQSSFTVGGGAELWRLWQALAAALTDGGPADRLANMSPRPPVQAAIDAIVAQLHEHDMLVTIRPGWDDADDPSMPPARIARWLESIAPDPYDAWFRLRAATWMVRGAGPVAVAARRALRQVGLPITIDGYPHGAILAADGHAVGAAADPEVGCVTPVGDPESVPADLRALRERVRMATGEPARPVLAALVAGAAAHRLVCAVAGLPDPGTRASSFTPLPAGLDDDRPSALIARLDPLRAEYHPWLRTAPPRPIPDGYAARATIEQALSGADALCDRELGPLPPVELADLPQLPAGLAVSRSIAGGGASAGGASAGGASAGGASASGGISAVGASAGGGISAVYGIGVNAAMARLGAVTGRAELLLRSSTGVDVAVGADDRHATGILLRRLLCARLDAAEPGPAVVAEADWAGSAHARLWWKTLTLRFGVAAEMRVTRLADGVFHAAVHAGGVRLGEAVECAPADAAAFAALSAAGAHQWREAGGDPDAVRAAPCAAVPASGSVGDGAPAWQNGDWIWPADLGDREQRLQSAMSARLGNPTITPLDPASGTALLTALTAVGFAALAVSG